MYCKFCGSKIDDDSTFCYSCGHKVSENKEIKEENHFNNNEKEKNKEESNGIGASIFAFFVFVAVVIGGLYAAVMFQENSDSKGNIIDKLVERSITKDDYYVYTSQDITSVTITITPKINIIYCDVECTVYTKENSLLYADTNSKSDLMANKSYSYTFDYGVGNAIFADHYSYKISGQCKVIY